MAQADRWRKAQEAEVSHHQKITPFNIKSYFRGKFDISAKKALDGKDIIEVGCGTGGMIYSISDYVDTHNQILGVDPVLSKINNIDFSTYPVVCAAGEQIPSKRNSFDVAISTNVLDHVLSPKRYLREINRVLRPGGDLYLKVNIFKRSDYIREIFDKFDNEHPHHFDPPKVLDGLKNSNFKIGYTNYDERKISDRNIFEWSLKWVLAYTIGGFDTMYVRASPKL